MWIEVEAIDGTLTAAREALAKRIANESFAWLSDVVRGVAIRVPSRGAERTITSTVVVVLRDGRRFDVLAVEENVADAVERACHEARREIAVAIGRPLRRRRGSEVEPSTQADRRASGT